MSRYYAFVRAVGGFFVRLLYPFNVVGKENIPDGDGGYIVCCNHTSVLDIAFLVVTFNRQIHFMAKQEIFKNKLIGRFMRNMGTFPVSRGSATGAVGAVKAAIDVIKSGRIFGIFPEGTRNHDGRPKAAKSGVALIAASTGAAALPVSVYYQGKMHPFKKVTLRIGKLIPAEDLKIEGRNRSELKRVSELIMSRITEQWEAGHC